MLNKRVPLVVVTILAVMAVFSSASVAQGQGKMIYLVTGEYIDPGPMLPPQQAAKQLEHVIIPSLDILAKMEMEKKILTGGILVGARAGVFIVEASSNEEVDQLVRGLPFWPLLSWEVTPLQSFAGRAVLDRQALKNLKAVPE